MIRKRYVFRKITADYDFEGDPGRRWFCRIVDSNANKIHGNPIVNYVSDGKVNITCFPAQLNMEHILEFECSSDDLGLPVSAVSKALGISKYWAKSLLISLIILVCGAVVLGVLALNGIKSPDKIWKHVPTISEGSEAIQNSDSFKTAFNSHPFYSSEVAIDWAIKNKKKLKDDFQWVGKLDEQGLFAQKQVLQMVDYKELKDYCKQYPFASIPSFVQLEFMKQNWVAGWKIDTLGGEWTSDQSFFGGSSKIYVPGEFINDMMAEVSQISNASGKELDDISANLGLGQRKKRDDSKYKEQLIEKAMEKRISQVHENAWFEDGDFWLKSKEQAQGRCVIAVTDKDWKGKE
jgi:hypothetical protein